MSNYEIRMKFDRLYDERRKMKGWLRARLEEFEKHLNRHVFFGLLMRNGAECRQCSHYLKLD